MPYTDANHISQLITCPHDQLKGISTELAQVSQESMTGQLWSVDLLVVGEREGERTRHEDLLKCAWKFIQA
jgi:hypothetical protein